MHDSLAKSIVKIENKEKNELEYDLENLLRR